MLPKTKPSSDSHSDILLIQELGLFFTCHPKYFFIVLHFQSYQEHLQVTSNDGSSLSSTVSLLEQTSELVSLFNDMLHITSVQDMRLMQLKKFLALMQSWANQTEGKPNLFVSGKLWFDLQSMCIGLNSLVSIKLSQFPQSVLKPAIINQDCMENHFGQVRSCMPICSNNRHKIQ